MRLMTFVASIATYRCFAAATRCGLHPGRIASVPFLLLGPFLIGLHVSTRLIVWLSLEMEASATTQDVALGCLNITIVALYSAIIYRN